MTVGVGGSRELPLPTGTSIGMYVLQYYVECSFPYVVNKAQCNVRIGSDNLNCYSGKLFDYMRVNGLVSKFIQYTSSSSPCSQTCTASCRIWPT